MVSLCAQSSWSFQESRVDAFETETGSLRFTVLLPIKPNLDEDADGADSISLVRTKTAPNLTILKPFFR